MNKIERFAIELARKAALNSANGTAPTYVAAADAVLRGERRPRFFTEMTISWLEGPLLCSTPIPDTETDEEKEGVDAIIFMQKLAGIDEPKAKALAGWRNMTLDERRKTLLAHSIMSGKRQACCG